MKNKHFRKKYMTLAMQKFILKCQYPESQCLLHSQKLIWNGIVKPTSLSRDYLIRIEYNGCNRPKVILYGKHIEGIERNDFPHHFHIDKQNQRVELCLHMSYEFDASQSIAQCIIPWTQEWLYYYEIWLATGEWLGGGHVPRK